MAIGHKRLNAKTPQPNEDITFITALEEYENHGEALKILEALAAQFRPITKQWGFGVTSLVEHEYNTQFGGRNWNGGEIIEIVLRRRDGSFAPYQFLLYVMAHELAHIKEMNHSYAFKAVNTQIRKELAALRANKYYGDGFWSTGRVLTSGRQEVPFEPDEQPVYTCGGAFKRRPRRRVRTSATANRAPRGAAKLGKTGRQTAIAPKPGGRVRKQGAFGGGGHVLDEALEMSTFRRKAGAKSAAEARAAAAEARINAEKRAKEKEAKLHVDKKPKLSSSPNGSVIVDLCSSDEEGDSEVEIIDEDPPVDDYTEEERAWMEQDIGSWQDDFKYVEDGQARASGSGAGVKAAAKSVAKESSSESSNKGKKRGVEISDDEAKPQKVLPKKVASQEAPPAPQRRWRASSEERQASSPTKPRRPLMKFFANDQSAQQRLEETSSRKKPRSSSSSSSPSKSRKRLLSDSDDDSDDEVDELASDTSDDDIPPAVKKAFKDDPEKLSRYVLREELRKEEEKKPRKEEKKRLRSNAKARERRRIKKAKEAMAIASASMGNAVAGPSGSRGMASTASGSGGRSGSQWACSACTLLNDYHEVACSICRCER